jgi:squalene synthase HpnC
MTTTAPRPAALVGEPATAVLAKAAAENFPVALRLLPAAIRRDLMAIYGFARLVDDIGDERSGSAADRERLLDAVDADLDTIYAGGQPRHSLLAALVPTVSTHALPAEPFRRLVLANRVDQRISRYSSFTDLMSYCELSANPVGRLVLGVFDAATPQRVAWSDDICTALQLAEHWQDVAEDLDRGRIYLPQEDLAAFGVSEADLVAAPAADRVRRLLAFEVRRARALLDRGSPLVASLSGPARIAVAGYVGGGRAALDAITAADFDVLSATRKASRPAVALASVRTLLESHHR